ncbi:MAG: cell division protein FtsA [Parcubacteria group bacterium]|nr:cell division protein FtsA [Parcubacteria group bacterium]
MGRFIATGINIGTANITAVVAGYNREQRDFRVRGAGSVLSGGMRKGMIVDPARVRDQVRSVVKDVERSSGAEVRHAYVGVGGAYLSASRAKGSVMVARADGEITENDLERVQSAAREQVSFANRQLLHAVPLSYTIDQDIVLRSPLSMSGAKLDGEVLFITNLYRHLQDVVRAVESAGVVVDDLVAAPLAASRVLLTTQQKEVGTALLDFGAETTTLAVFEEGNISGLTTFQIGSVHITQDIALGLQLPLREAEQLKCNFRSDPAARRKIHTIVEARLGDVFELVERYLKKIGRNGLLPGGVVCTGGGMLLGNVPELARSTLHLPAELGRVRYFQDTPQYSEDPGFSVALGLCVEGLADEERAGVTHLGVAGIHQARRLVGRWLRAFLP